MIDLHNKSKAYLISLQMYHKACTEGQLKKVTFEQYSEGSYERVDTGQQAMYTPENIVVMKSTMFVDHELSPRAIKLFLSIVPQLCMHNALWFFDHTQCKADSAAIKELREANILFKTEEKTIHFVNPEYLRKGSKPAVLVLTTKELENVKRVTIDNIRPLGARSMKVKMNALDAYVARTSHV